MPASRPTAAPLPSASVPELNVSAEATINAPSTIVLTILRDLDGHHRAILPPAFSNLVIEAGGIGAGTVSRFDLTLGGRTRQTRTRIEEPAPGVIREHVIGRDMVTTFTVMPDGNHSRLRIETWWRAAAGPAGILERLLLPGMFRRLYREELINIDRYAQAMPMAAAKGSVG